MAGRGRTATGAPVGDPAAAVSDPGPPTATISLDDLARCEACAGHGCEVCRDTGVIYDRAGRTRLAKHRRAAAQAASRAQDGLFD